MSLVVSHDVVGGMDITFSAVCSNRKVRSIYLSFLYSFRCSPCTSNR